MTSEATAVAAPTAPAQREPVLDALPAFSAIVALLYVSGPWLRLRQEPDPQQPGREEPIVGGTAGS